MKALMTALCALALTAGPAYADAGDLDTGFGEGGTIRFDDVHQGRIVATALRPDGRIVAAAVEEERIGVNQNIVVYRLLPDGTLDRSFDRDGVAKINIAAVERPTDVALAPDGKILISGTVSPGVNDTYDAVVLRLLADGGPGPVNGALDPSFDGDGFATVDSGADEEAVALALRSDGKIVLAGTTVASVETANVVVYRLKANGGSGAVNGALDPSFDDDGAAGLDTGASDFARDMALRPDGTIVLAATAIRYPDIKQTGIAMQVRPDGGPGRINGALDPAFDDDGVAGIEVGVRLDPQALALRPDGRIVLAGGTRAAANGQRDGVVIQLRAGGGSGAVNGALDPAFGREGMATIETPNNDDVTAVALQPDGKILAAGQRAVDQSDRAVVYRVLADGGAQSGSPLDLSFGAAGVAAFPASTSFDTAYAIALRPDGGIVAGGITYAPGMPALPIVGRLLGDPGPPVIETPQPGPGPVVVQPTGDAPTRNRAAFGARTRVTLRIGRRSKAGRVKVRVRNANAFLVRGKLSAKGAKARTFTLSAGETRTVTLRLRLRRGRARVTATVVDPAGQSRVVRAARAVS
jgi:uncharacterized delta-60 repeat protein